MKVALYGDSTARGMTLKASQWVQSELNIPAVCGGLLCLTLQNKAIGGATSPDFLYGGGPVTTPWEAEMACSDADWVGINTAINDAFLPNYGINDFRWCYGEFTRIARLHGKKIFFMTPNPIDNTHNAILWDFQHNMNDVAVQMSVPLIDQYNAIATACPQWRTMLCDGVHPKDELYRFMGHVAYMTMAPILKEI